MALRQVGTRHHPSPPGHLERVKNRLALVPKREVNKGRIPVVVPATNLAGEFRAALEGLAVVVRHDLNLLLAHHAHGKHRVSLHPHGRVKRVVFLVDPVEQNHGLVSEPPGLKLLFPRVSLAVIRV